MNLQNQIDQLMVEFNRTTKAMEDMTSRLNESSHTKQSANRMVSATVDSKGELTNLTFHTTAYRNMAPKELGALLTTLIREVRSSAQAEVMDAMSGFMPAGGGVLASIANGAPVDRQSIFSELEQAFAWGKKASEPKPAKAAKSEDGWTGDRRPPAPKGKPAARKAAPKPKATPPPAPVLEDEAAEEGWTGERKAVAKPTRPRTRTKSDD